jgi:hypothetical protein
MVNFDHPVRDRVDSRSDLLSGKHVRDYVTKRTVVKWKMIEGWILSSR